MAGLETAASIIAIINLSAKIAVICTKYIADVKDAKEDVERLEKEIEAVRAIFTSAREPLDNSESSRLSASQNLHNTISNCLSLLEELNDRLQLKNQKLMRRYGLRALKWPFKTQEVDKFVRILAGHKQTVLVALQIDQT